jgi:hypothetical protein
MPTKPTKVIVDCSTGVSTEVELTDDEIAELQANAEAHNARRAVEEAEAEAKAQAKSSAEAKLASLGLTTEEIAALQ